MEKDSPSKPSVAELAGRFKGHILPAPSSNDERPVRRRPPTSLKLQQKENKHEDVQKSLSPPNAPRVRTRNSALIEKLQANLALSPTALLPSPKSPELKLPPAPLSPTSPERTPPSPGLSPPSPGLSPLTPLTPLSPGLRHLSSEEEDPISFEAPPDGATLPSLHKTRARLSFKRRPPTRQHRRSTHEEEEEEEADKEELVRSPCDPPSPRENGLGHRLVEIPAPVEAGGEPEEDEDITERDTIQEEQEEEEESVKRNTVRSEEDEEQPCPAEAEEEEEATEETATQQNQ